MNRKSLVKCISQIIAELKIIDKEGEIIPNFSSIGTDINLCWFHNDLIIEYLDYKDVDWTISPSKFYKNKNLFDAILHDESINPYIYDGIKDIDFKQIINEMSYLNDNGVLRKQMPTEHSSMKIFFEFVDKVLKNPKEYEENPNRIVGIFLSIFNYPDDTYLHENYDNILVTKADKKVKINKLGYNSFFSRYSKNITVEELDKINSLSYLLIEELSRRFKGEVYTPNHVSDAAHEEQKETIGDHYLNIPTWDQSSGLKGDTRFYKYHRLYCSTINPTDIKVAKKYNQGSIDFPYDFFTSNFHKLPYELRMELGLIENENEKDLKLVEEFNFTNNPPMKHSGSLHGNVKLHGKGLTKTMVSKRVQKLNLGGSGNIAKETSCLYLLEQVNILLRSKLKKAFITTYLNANILTKGAFYGLRKYLYDSGCRFLSGFIFPASEFSGNSKNWAMVFIIFQWKRNLISMGTNFIDQYPLKIRKNINGKLTVTGYKTLHGVNNILTFWPKSIVETRSDILVPSITSALKPTGMLGKVKNGCIGYLSRSRGDNWVVCSTIWVVSGTTITKHNFMESVALFSCGKLVPSVVSTWLAESSEMMEPNFNHTEYKQWNNDCIIFSLFNSESEQSSLRKIKCDGFWTDVKNGDFEISFHDVKNEWFWNSNQQIFQLANQCGNNDIVQDTKNFNQEAFVYSILQNIKLSDDANEILHMANDLLVSSFPERKKLHTIYPEWHLNTWDAGWHQIKKILENTMRDELDKFNYITNIEI